ncbi:hypothetical protein PENTCL1PPCAC_10764, partial [Pristionchus entomophagus]
AEWPINSPSRSTMNLWEFLRLLSWNPVTRKLVFVLVAAVTSAALYLTVNQFTTNSEGKKEGTGAGGEIVTPIGPEAKTPAKRRRRRRSSAANSPNRNNAASSASSSSIDSNTAPGISAAAMSVVCPSSSASGSQETHSERAVSPSTASEPKAAAAAAVAAERKGDQEEQLPRTSLCGCRVLKKGEPIPDTEALFDASKRPVLGETSPVVDYKSFEPLRLCDPILGKKTEVTPASKRPAALQIEQSYLTPFQSILQSLEFADKHAYLIESLVDNYEWLQ